MTEDKPITEEEVAELERHATQFGHMGKPGNLTMRLIADWRKLRDEMASGAGYEQRLRELNTARSTAKVLRQRNVSLSARLSVLEEEGIHMACCRACSEGPICEDAPEFAKLVAERNGDT